MHKVADAHETLSRLPVDIEKGADHDVVGEVDTPTSPLGPTATQNVVDVHEMELNAVVEPDETVAQPELEEGVVE